VHKVTIIPRGRALGVTMQLPDQDRYSMDRDRLLSTIAVLFGGRIAEEVFMGQMTTGASNDFERATAIARSMVTQWGMSDEMGTMVYGENEGEVFLGRSITTHKNVSEATLQKVDQEIRKIHRPAVFAREEADPRQPRQGRGDDQGLARVGNHRRRPDQRHHGRQAAAPPKPAQAPQQPPRRARRALPSRRRRRPIRGSPPTLHCGRFRLDLSRPLLMGVVNVTPDSFSTAGASSSRRPRSLTPGRWSRRAPTSSTSARSRAGRGRAASAPKRSCRGSCRCWKASLTAPRRFRSTPPSPR